MKITTAYPVIINKKRENYQDFYLNIDGENSAQVKQFHIFANSKGANLKVDGKYGAKSKKAYKTYGADFEKFWTALGGVASSGGNITGKPAFESGTSSSTPSEKEIKEKKAKGYYWDKAKGVWGKAKESGLIDKLGELLGLNMGGGGGGGQSSEADLVSTNAPAEDPTAKKGMSTGVKIAIGVGIVVVVGAIIYFATKKPSTPAPAVAK